MSEEEEKRDSQADLTSLSQGESVLAVEGPESSVGTWADLHDDDDDDNFIAIYMYITRHTCNGMRFAPELLHSMLPTIQSFHPYST